MDRTPAFQPEAFELLRGIRAEPTVHYYHDHKAAFRQYVEGPLQALMRAAAGRLPAMAQSRLETRRNVFSRFPKNDFGRGLAWANYWGAFYPKGSRRIMDAQLAVWMDADRLNISFYINDYGIAPRQRFARNCNRYSQELLPLLGELTRLERVYLAYQGRTRLDETGRAVPERALTWPEWLEDPEQGDDWVFMSFTPAEVTSLPLDDLQDWVVRLFGLYFPLALLAMEEAPLPLIEAYVG